MENKLMAANAEKKLIEEKRAVKGQKETMMASAVLAALVEFAKQSGEFAQAILESEKSFADCMTAVAKGVGSSISDLEAYRRAVAFYFQGADIKFHMTIDLCGSVGGEEPVSGLTLSLEDLIDGI